MRLVWLLSIALTSALVGVALLISMAVPGWTLEEEPPISTPKPPAQTEVVTIVVRQGDSAKVIGESLESTGVIRSSRLFETLVALLGYENALHTGVYDFEPGLGTTEIIDRLHGGITSPLQVTIPEGLRIEEIANLLEERGIVSGADFLAALRRPGNWRGTPAEQRPPGVSLEGYLFPATYRISLRATADDIARLMLQRLAEEFPEARRQEIAAGGRNVHEVLTLASIIEREAVLKDEQPLIASVFSNRLAQGMLLEADPTVQYAVAQMPGSVEQFGYWKEALTLADLAIASPYNTYGVAGLPPTPIANPGAGAIAAAIQPAETTSLFFVACGSDGAHLFADTLEEHQANVERCLGPIVTPPPPESEGQE